jgi:hypothetical protein
MKIDDDKLQNYKGNPHDEIHNSYKGLWKIKRRATRKIPEGAKIHKSVFDRINNDKNNYKPQNLPKKHVIVS